MGRSIASSSGLRFDRAIRLLRVILLLVSSFEQTLSNHWAQVAAREVLDRSRLQVRRDFCRR